MIDVWQCVELLGVRVASVLLVGCALSSRPADDWGLKYASREMGCPTSRLVVRAHDEDSGYNIFSVCGCGQERWFYDAFYHRNFHLGMDSVPGHEGWYESALPPSGDCGP